MSRNRCDRCELIIGEGCSCNGIPVRTIPPPEILISPNGFAHLPGACVHFPRRRCSRRSGAGSCPPPSACGSGSAPTGRCAPAPETWSVPPSPAAPTAPAPTPATPDRREATSAGSPPRWPGGSGSPWRQPSGPSPATRATARRSPWPGYRSPATRWPRRGAPGEEESPTDLAVARGRHGQDRDGVERRGPSAAAVIASGGEFPRLVRRPPGRRLRSRSAVHRWT